MITTVKNVATQFDIMCQLPYPLLGPGDAYDLSQQHTLTPGRQRDTRRFHTVDSCIGSWLPSRIPVQGGRCCARRSNNLKA